VSDQADTEPLTEAAANGKPAAEADWLTDGRGRLYVKRTEGAGVVFRRGEESIAEALARDSAEPRDKRPRSRSAKSKRPKMPPAPSKVDLKQLEHVLSEALQAPAMPCAMFGDEWAANHFTQQGPYLARNLIAASEHNPWLRRKLEDAATGQDAAVKLISVVGIAGALFGYAVPPVVWWFNLPVPDKAREMFGVPPARDRAPAAPPADPAAVAA
jgi:hypothetical protein